jgi:hypothetical protein
MNEEIGADECDGTDRPAVATRGPNRPSVLREDKNATTGIVTEADLSGGGEADRVVHTRLPPVEPVTVGVEDMNARRGPVEHVQRVGAVVLADRDFGRREIVQRSDCLGESKIATPQDVHLLECVCTNVGDVGVSVAVDCDRDGHDEVPRGVPALRQPQLGQAEQLQPPVAAVAHDQDTASGVESQPTRRS